MTAFVGGHLDRMTDLGHIDAVGERGRPHEAGGRRRIGRGARQARGRWCAGAAAAHAGAAVGVGRRRRGAAPRLEAECRGEHDRHGRGDAPGTVRRGPAHRIGAPSRSAGARRVEARLAWRCRLERGAHRLGHRLVEPLAAELAQRFALHAPCVYPLGQRRVRPHLGLEGVGALGVQAAVDPAVQVVVGESGGGLGHRVISPGAAAAERPAIHPSRSATARGRATAVTSPSRPAGRGSRPPRRRRSRPRRSAAAPRDATAAAA